MRRNLLRSKCLCRLLAHLVDFGVEGLPGFFGLTQCLLVVALFLVHFGLVVEILFMKDLVLGLALLELLIIRFVISDTTLHVGQLVVGTDGHVLHLDPCMFVLVNQLLILSHTCLPLSPVVQLFPSFFFDHCFI